MTYAMRKEALSEAVKGVPSQKAFLSLLTDEALLLEFQSGRDEAFDVLYLRYRGRLLVYLRRMLSNAAMAEEVYNTTMYRVYTRLGDVANPAQLRSYLYKAAYRSCLNANRREYNLKRMPPQGRSWGGTSTAAFEESSPEDRLASHELLALTRRYMDSLPDERRAALLLFHNDGLTYQEIADVLERPIGTVRWLIHVARAAMARHLESHLQIPA